MGLLLVPMKPGPHVHLLWHVLLFSEKGGGGGGRLQLIHHWLTIDYLIEFLSHMRTAPC